MNNLSVGFDGRLKLYLHESNITSVARSLPNQDGMQELPMRPLLTSKISFTRMSVSKRMK